jgi:hypothetical protein
LCWIEIKFTPYIIYTELTKLLSTLYKVMVAIMLMYNYIMAGYNGVMNINLLMVAKPLMVYENFYILS